MDDNKRLGQGAKDPNQRFVFPYRSLLHVSRSLGHTAMHRLSNVREFLSTELSLPNPAELLGLGPKAKENISATTAAATVNLGEMALRSHEILASARTVFPLTLFPSSVILDRSKVTIVMRNFLLTENVVSIRIDDILNVSTSVGPFFGSLNIISRVMNSVDHYPINFLWRSDALRLKRLIQGYVIARHDKMKISHLPKDELYTTLLELGHDR